MLKPEELLAEIEKTLKDDSLNPEILFLLQNCKEMVQENIDLNRNFNDFKDTSKVVANDLWRKLQLETNIRKNAETILSNLLVYYQEVTIFGFRLKKFAFMSEAISNLNGCFEKTVTSFLKRIEELTKNW